jgi:putative selenium metabolism hydrolase
MMSEISKYIERHVDWLVETTQAFIRTPSVSGAEGTIAQLLVRVLDGAGLPTRVDRAGNVVGTLAATGGEASGQPLVFNIHLDTVPAGPSTSWKHDTFGAEVKSGKIYGRGACDTKGAWAPMILAMEAVKESGVALNRPVLFTGVVMEELTCSIGMKVLLDETLSDTRPAYMILGEPTGLNLAIGHKGRTELWITTTGRSCHASAPGSGDNALYRAAPAIEAVERLAEKLQRETPDPLFGRSSLAMTDIVCSPGARNVVPDSATMYVDYRFLPRDTPESVEERVRQALTLDWVEAKVRIGEQEGTTYTGMQFAGKKFMAGFTLDEAHPLVTAAAETIASTRGARPSVYRWNFATDGAYSAGVLGIPTIGFSPCDELLAHVIDEYVEIEAMIMAAKVYAAMIMKLAG